MTTIVILPKTEEKKEFIAVANGREFVGKTAGAALDALTANYPATNDEGLFLLWQNWQPDEFFNSKQQKRLAELMEKWRAARDKNEADES